MLQKIRGDKQLLFALWMTTYSVMTGALNMQLQPRYVVKHVNESLELVCTALDCPGEAQFMWWTLIDTKTSSTKTTLHQNGATSRKVYSHITQEDDGEIVCKVLCGAEKQIKAKIKVYSFPSDPVLSRLNHSTLMCTVRSVYPTNEFTISWLQGETLLTERTDPGDQGDDETVTQDISSVYTPSKEDVGKNITCRVTLDLNGVPEDHKVRSVTSQYGPASPTISRNTTVKVGERLELRCDADGTSNIKWRRLGKSEAAPLTTNKVIVVEKAALSHAGMYECEASNELASRRSTVSVIVEGPPNVPNIRVSQEGNPTAGDNVTIFCDSDNVLPRLTISGASMIQEEKQSSTVSLNLPSIQLRDSGTYHCDAQNEFGSTRSSVNFTVQAPPRNSTVVVYPSAQVMEAQNITIHCKTVSFPPASITLRREGDWHKLLSPNGIFHLIDLKSEDNGTYTVNFTNALGYETQTIEIIVVEQQTITSILTKTLVPSVGSISLLTAAALVLRHLRRTKKGSLDPSFSEALEL